MRFYKTFFYMLNKVSQYASTVEYVSFMTYQINGFSRVFYRRKGVIRSLQGFVDWEIKCVLQQDLEYIRKPTAKVVYLMGVVIILLKI